MRKSPRNLFAIAFALLVGALPLLSHAQTDLDVKTFRPYGPQEAYLFEKPQMQPTSYDGMTLYLGGAFTQQFQALDHSNESDIELADIGANFNLATANLYVGAQLAEGVRVDLETYLSSRHHPEAWVKGGYLIVDAVPFLGSETLDNVMEYLTIRAGHFEINYGDAHFRRTDNGQAIMNPFVGNYIMDSFTTEVGAEVYYRNNGILAMAALTGGELNPSVQTSTGIQPSFYGKLGYDSQVNDDLRLRLTGSAYTSRSGSISLYGGDRAGARFYSIMYPAEITGRDPFSNPRLNPRFGESITAFQINPFVQFQGFELFGLIEMASGTDEEDGDSRSVNQYAVEALYRFLENNQLYLGGRYNVASGEFFGPNSDVSSTRIEVGGGWFITPNVLMKAEYVQQTFDDFAEASHFHGGEFSGFMVEGVVAF